MKREPVFASGGMARAEPPARSPRPARDETAGRPDRTREGQGERREARGHLARTSRERLEGQHDQRVAGEDGKRLSEHAMHGGLAAPRARVVEAWQVVVDGRRAVHELEGARSGLDHGRCVVAACPATARQRRGRILAPPGRRRTGSRSRASGRTLVVRNGTRERSVDLCCHRFPLPGGRWFEAG